eukprot:5322555-Lingulodinium_polyedra.AAC.1
MLRKRWLRSERAPDRPRPRSLSVQLAHSAVAAPGPVSSVPDLLPGPVHARDRIQEANHARGQLVGPAGSCS